MAEAKNRRGPKIVTEAHKAAMATGRAEGRAVSIYLNSLEASPAKVHQRKAEWVKHRLDVIAAEIGSDDVMSRLDLVQERINLEADLARIEEGSTRADHEAAFIRIAKNYSRRRGISYRAWREVGVPAAVLRAADIPRTASGVA